MNKQSVSDSVKELLAQGDTGKALQLLINFLENESGHPDLLRTLRVAEANFHAARQQEQKGILDFSEARREYAKTNDAALSVLEQLMSGVRRGTAASRQKSWTLAASGLVLLLFIAGWFYFRGGFPNTLSAIESGNCPKFRPEGYKVMVLEFQKLSGEDSKPELGIQSRIRELTQKNQINTDVRILQAKAFNSATPDQTEALAMAQQCQADMIIWGDYEKSTDSISVDIRYTLTDSTLPPGVALETFKNVNELKNDRMKISNLDEAVFRLCTVMALHENRIDLASKWLQKIEHPTAPEMELKDKLKVAH